MRSVSSSQNEKHQSSQLSQHVEEIATLDVATAVEQLVKLLPKTTTYVSALGSRAISNPSYRGTAELNRLASIYLRLGRRCAEEDADLETRLAHYDLHPSFEKLYKTSANALGENSVGGFFQRCCNSTREFSLVCGHCVGFPPTVIPHRDRADEALMFKEGVFAELFGEREFVASSSTFDRETKTMRTLKGAKREWVEEASRKEREGKSS